MNTKINGLRALESFALQRFVNDKTKFIISVRQFR